MIAAAVASVALAASVSAAQPSPSLSQLAGQRVVYAFTGSVPPPPLIKRIGRRRAAAVILFEPNVGNVRSLTRQLQAAVPDGDPPLLVMTDQEGGPVRRIPGAPQESGAELAARPPSAARAAGLAAAHNLERAGVNVDLAPLADVGRAGSALVQERRTLGRTPAAAGARAAAFTRGLRAGGVAATAKHFPGFGAAGANTDDASVRIELSASELRSVDRAPFRDAVAAGAQLVMISTAIYPALDDAPAALSRQVATGELRGGLGFDGVSITDSLEGRALAREGSVGTVALRAAKAGADLLTYSGHYETGSSAAAALERAARAGELPRAELEASAKRIRQLRESLR